MQGEPWAALWGDRPVSSPQERQLWVPGVLGEPQAAFAPWREGCRVLLLRYPAF